MRIGKNNLVRIDWDKFEVEVRKKGLNYTRLAIGIGRSADYIRSIIRNNRKILKTDVDKIRVVYGLKMIELPDDNSQISVDEIAPTKKSVEVFNENCCNQVQMQDIKKIIIDCCNAILRAMEE